MSTSPRDQADVKRPVRRVLSLDGEGWPVAVGLAGLGLAGAGAFGWFVALAPAGGAARFALTDEIVASAALLGGAWACVIAGRHLLRPIPAVKAIRAALGDVGRGVRERQALEVSERLGPEAEAWNALIAEFEALAHDRFAKRVDRALAEARGGSDRLRRGIDAMHIGVLLVDADGTVRVANGAAAVLLGMKREQLESSALTNMVEGRKEAMELASVAAGTGKPRASIEVERAGSSPAILRLTARSIGREDRLGAIVTIEDMTQQRLADRMRDSFVAQATHELRTPLTNIRLYVEQVIDEGDEDPTARAKAMNVINTEARRLERIVGDMLSVSEMEAGSLSLRRGDVRLDQLFGDLREDYQAQSEDKGVALKFELPPKVGVINADRDKLTLALHNLVGNALKYTERGGSVTVQVICDEGGGLIVEVDDTGMGIDEEELDKIFEKFYRSTDDRVKHVSGTGLGLSLAREVVRLHGGDITVRSELNKGSTFTLTLPASVDRASLAA